MYVQLDLKLPILILSENWPQSLLLSFLDESLDHVSSVLSLLVNLLPDILNPPVFHLLMTNLTNFHGLFLDILIREDPPLNLNLLILPQKIIKKSIKPLKHSFNLRWFQILKEISCKSVVKL